MLLGFKKRFVPFIEDGSKTHTIRAKRTIRPRVGEICHCYTGLRQKGARLLGRWPCVKVEDIRIVDCAGYGIDVYIEDVCLSDTEKNALAWRDGFRARGQSGAFAEMVAYWQEMHPRKDGILDFFGVVIHWRYVK